MTDRRGTDLSYGHLGEASYDLDESSWSFSRGIASGISIQPLHLLQQCIPPSLSSPSNSVGRNAHVLSTQNRWLRNSLPETGPAVATLSSMRSLDTGPTNPPPSTLFAIGYATDVDHMSGSRPVPIMAKADGEAGNVLRLIKPRNESLGWDGSHGAKLRSLNPTSAEDCYWLGDGGPIQKISFAADTDGTTSWLAVLKAESTTIFRPIYRRSFAPAAVSKDLGVRYPPSRLFANPIISLKAEKYGSTPHADVSFNPWYARQFATLDQQGYWSIWDIEGQRSKRTTFDAKLGRSGHIHGDLGSDQGFSSNNNADGWGRILWAGEVGIIAVCNRRHFTLFNLKSVPKKLISQEIIASSSNDWILDMRRSPANLSHIFILTTSCIFWLEVVSAREYQDEKSSSDGARVLLSYRHFRKDEDGSMKLEAFREDNYAIVSIYSAQNPLVNTYRFGLSFEGSATPVCSQDSFSIGHEHSMRVDNVHSALQTMCLIPMTFVLSNINPLSGPVKQYIEQNIRFYQLFHLTETLELSQTLCATRRLDPENLGIGSPKLQTVPAPTQTATLKGGSSVHIVDDDFIVSDWLEETEDVTYDPPIAAANSRILAAKETKMRDDASRSIDASQLFQISFLESKTEEFQNASSPDAIDVMAEYVKNISQIVQDRKQRHLQGLQTFIDLAAYVSSVEDIDEAASSLRGFIDSFNLNENDEGAMVATFLAPGHSPIVELGRTDDVNTNPLDLSHFYDKLVDFWVSCLPRNTPGPVRLAKERLVRGIATELCLSSLAISIRDKSVVRPKPFALHEGVDFVLPVRTKQDSIEIQDSHITEESDSTPILSPPELATVATLPSEASERNEGDTDEDESISRLRCYALSIRSQPPLGAARSAILSHWPSIPGSDPSMYSWEASRAAFAEDQDIEEDEEEALFQRREVSRRRRRTENFLKRQRVNTLEMSTQATPALPFGSQPNVAQHAPSSQSMEMTMTQPDRGTFGSRQGQKASKKRRKMGF